MLLIQTWVSPGLSDLFPRFTQQKRGRCSLINEETMRCLRFPEYLPTLAWGKDAVPIQMSPDRGRRSGFWGPES